MPVFVRSFLPVITVAVAVSLAISYVGVPRVSSEGNPNAGQSLMGVNEVVINEIDYDQPGNPDNAEFIELKNISGVTVNLDSYFLDLVNGQSGGATIYTSIDLPSVDLAPGDYYVICSNAANVPNCDLDVSPDTDLIQNGSPDAIGLRLLGGAVVEAVSYEGESGPPYVETLGTSNGVTGSDSNSVAFVGLSRFPDGNDTDNNFVDFVLSCITPGRANVSISTGCAAPTAGGVSISGRVTDVNGRGISKVRLNLVSPDGEVFTALSNVFGYYSFEDIPVGQTYTLSIRSKGRQFNDPVRVVNLNDAISNVDFVAN